MWIVVMAIAALVVLVILIAIATGGFTRFKTGLEEEEKGAIALKDWFAGYGCQPSTTQVKTCGQINDEPDCKNTPGCSWDKTCSGSLCKEFTQEKCEGKKYCKWVPRPETS